MATIYFTSNADSGDGTLRDAITNANAGDVITYDPAVFTSGPVVISLSSYLPIFPNGATLDGGELGIIIDGQNRIIDGYSAFRSLETLTVINITLRQYKVSTNSPIYVNDVSTSHIYKRCKFVENSGVWYGSIYLRNGSISMYDCLVAGNVATGSATTSGGIAIAEGQTLDFVRSTLCGNRKGNIGSGSLTRLNNVNSFVGLTPPEIDGVTPDEIGFVNPPPSEAIPEADYTAGDWESWDFRLKATSAYLTGAAYNPGELDLLGHARTGSWGAFDGSWLVAPATVSASSSVDFLEIGSSGTLTLSGTDVILTVSRGTYFSAGGSAVSASRGYIVLPAGETSSGLTLSNVVCAYSGAGASNFAATTSGMTWSAVDSAVSVVLELEVSGAWTTIVQTTGTSYSTPLSAGSNVRLFDGAQFLTATVPAGPTPPAEFDFHPWGTYSATITVATSSAFSAITQTAPPFAYLTEYILMSDFYNAGETPVLFARITNSQTGEIIPASDVSGISYTCNKLSVGWGTETRTPVEGHEAVDVDASAVLAALVTNDPRWTIDTTGYNFKLEPDSRTNPIFPSSGNYEIIVTIEFSNANPLPLVFNVTVN